MRYADRFFFDDSAESIDLLRSWLTQQKNAALSIQIYASLNIMADQQQRRMILERT